MTLPPSFLFSQNNLQDYIECPRRFQLRHLLKQKWPGLESQPVLAQEARMKQGQTFHQMILQHQSGLPADRLNPPPAEIDLWRWWHNYLESPPTGLPEARYPEYTLAAPFAGYRLGARYDMLAVDPGGRIVIVDWKTARKKPARPTLEARIQTRLYPFLVVLAGWRLNNGQPVEPQQVEMIYWFAEQPDQPEIFQYDALHFEVDRQELYRLVTQIASIQETVFFQTTREKFCTYCTYRSLCHRGMQAGPWSSLEDEPENDPDDLSSFDFTQAGEISF